jgi:hypothetical protein
VRRVDHSGRHPSAWGWLVTVSACVVGGGLLTLAVWWGASSETRIASYAVRGSLESISLDLGSADAEIVGGGDDRTVAVRRTDEFAFGQDANVQREVSAGVLRIRSRCPSTVLRSCSAGYRLTVPDNVAVMVRTDSGDVRINGFRGSATIETRAGDVAIGAYCGFALRARAETGDVRATASCPPERLELRSGSGDVRALVPPGRYRIDAETDGGTRRVAGLTTLDDAPFAIQALSSSGDVDVEAGP